SGCTTRPRRCGSCAAPSTPPTARWPSRRSRSAAGPAGSRGWGTGSARGRPPSAWAAPPATRTRAAPTARGRPAGRAPSPVGLPSWTPLGGNWGRAPIVMPLAAAGGEQTAHPDGGLLGDADLHRVVDAALTRLAAAGVDPALVARLASAEYVVGAVPWGDLGVA